MQEFSQAQAVADQVTKGQPVDANAGQFLIVLAQAISSQRQTLQSAAQLIEAMSGDTNVTTNILSNQAAAINDVHARLSTLESQSKHGPGNSIMGH